MGAAAAPRVDRCEGSCSCPTHPKLSDAYGVRPVTPKLSRSPALRMQVRLTPRVVDVDALLAHRLGDRLLVGLDVLLEPDPLLRDGPLLGHGLLLVEHDLVLLL